MPLRSRGVYRGGRTARGRRFVPGKIAGRRAVPRGSVEEIGGIGPEFAARLRDEFGVTTTDGFLAAVRRVGGARGRRELLKRMFRGVTVRRVNRGAFGGARDWLVARGVDVTDMTVPRDFLFER